MLCGFYKCTVDIPSSPFTELLVVEKATSKAMRITVAVLIADGLLLADALSILFLLAAAAVLSLYHWISPGILQVFTKYGSCKLLRLVSTSYVLQTAMRCTYSNAYPGHVMICNPVGELGGGAPLVGWHDNMHSFYHNYTQSAYEYC